MRDDTTTAPRCGAGPKSSRMKGQDQARPARRRDAALMWTWTLIVTSPFWRRPPPGTPPSILQAIALPLGRQPAGTLKRASVEAHATTQRRLEETQMAQGWQYASGVAPWRRERYSAGVRFGFGSGEDGSSRNDATREQAGGLCGGGQTRRTQRLDWPRTGRTGTDGAGATTQRRNGRADRDGDEAPGR